MEDAVKIVHLRGIKSKRVVLAMVCSFFGHSDTPQTVYPKLKESIVYFITQKNTDSFLVGNHGEFDRMVLKALRELKRTYPHICYSVVLAYMPTRKRDYDTYEEAETLLPEGIELTPKRFAISWRNKWMVKQSDLVLCYIAHAWGGAVQFVEYAQRQGKEIINLFEEGRVVFPCHCEEEL